MNIGYKKLNNLIGWSVFVIAAITYLLTIEPKFSFWDCGEYISSAIKLEVTHSPGAVFFQILGSVWALFAMGSNEKYSIVINAMSAIMSAFAILFLFWTITHMTRKILFPKQEPEQYTGFQQIMILLSGATGALTFTFTDTFWFSAVEGEVYAAASCFTALLLWLICKWENDNSTRSDKWLVLISLIIGLSVGVHLMAILVVPALGYIYYTKKYDFSWKGFFIANIIIGGIFIFVFKIIFPLTMAFFGKSEIFFVNNLQMPFNTGSVVACIIIIIAFYFGLKYTIKNGYALANTIVLCILFMLIGFSSWVVLPIRANANTPINLNDPDNAIGMLDYYNRAQYGDWPVFYGANYTAYLDPNGILRNKDIDNGPIYEKDEKSQRYIITGKRTSPVFNSEHVSILPRMYNPAAMNEYAAMEGFPEFSANPDYVEQETDKRIQGYIQSNIGNVSQQELQQIYSKLHSTIEPQIQRDQQKILDTLQVLKKQGKITIEHYKKYAEMMKIERPTLWQNVDFMLRYQMGYMLGRYFMWNFVGRQNDIQGRHDKNKGNWISGINSIDKIRVGDQSKLPETYKGKAHNTYYFLPLLLGLVGLFFQINRDPGRNFALISLFLLTSAGIILYTNVKAYEPRERDYALVSSFYTFAIWIGLGTAAIMYGLNRLKKEKIALVAGFLTLGVPILVGFQNWDDHDRSRRYTAYDFSKSYLEGLDKNNPILFVYGDNDTYPLWALQETEEFRSDAKVINYTLLTTPWYIDQTLRKTYKAPALPSNLVHEEYREGVNDIIIPIEKSMWIEMVQRLSLSDKYKQYVNGISAKDAISFIKNNDIQSQIRDLFGYKNNIGFIPSQTILIPVNKENALKYGIVKQEDAGLMVDNLKLQVKGNISKEGLATLSLYSNYNWDRSIYFSSGGTYSPENLFFTQDYLEYQGLVSKLVPIYTASKKDSRTFGRINPNNIYELVKNYKFGNLKDPKAYFDETCRSNIINYRMSAAAAAEALANANEKAKAEEILDLINKEIPMDMYMLSNYFDIQSFMTMAKTYFKIGREQKGLQLIERYKKQIKEELGYFKSFSGLDRREVQQDINQLTYYYFLILDGTTEAYLSVNKDAMALQNIETAPKEDKIVDDIYQLSLSIGKYITIQIISGKEQDGLAVADMFRNKSLEDLNKYLALSSEEQTKFDVTMGNLSNFYQTITEAVISAYKTTNEKEKAVKYLEQSFIPLDKRLESIKGNKVNMQNISIQNLIYSYSNLLQTTHTIDSALAERKFNSLSEILR